MWRHCDRSTTPPSPFWCLRTRPIGSKFQMGKAATRHAGETSAFLVVEDKHHERGTTLQLCWPLSFTSSRAKPSQGRRQPSELRVLTLCKHRLNRLQRIRAFLYGWSHSWFFVTELFWWAQFANTEKITKKANLMVTRSQRVEKSAHLSRLVDERPWPPPCPPNTSLRFFIFIFLSHLR